MECRADRVARRIALAALHCRWGDEDCVAAGVEWALAAGGCDASVLREALRSPAVLEALERVGVSLEDLLERSLGDSRLAQAREEIAEALMAVAGGGSAEAGLPESMGAGKRRTRIAVARQGLLWRLGGLAASVFGVTGAGVMASRALWMLGVVASGNTSAVAGGALVLSSAAAAAYAGAAVAGGLMVLAGHRGVGRRAGSAVLGLTLAGLILSLLAAPLTPP